MPRHERQRVHPSLCLRGDSSPRHRLESRRAPSSGGPQYESRHPRGGTLHGSVERGSATAACICVVGISVSDGRSAGRQPALQWLAELLDPNAIDPPSDRPAAPKTLQKVRDAVQRPIGRRLCVDRAVVKRYVGASGLRLPRRRGFGRQESAVLIRAQIPFVPFGKQERERRLQRDAFIACFRVGPLRPAGHNEVAPGVRFDLARRVEARPIARRKERRTREANCIGPG